MEQLSKKEQEIFDFIKHTIESRGVAPSVREVAKAAGYRSPSTAQYMLDRLEEAGYIQRDPMLKRTIRLCTRDTKAVHIPLVGTVTAGKPILAVESIEDYISVPLSDNGGKEFFALRVRGDSMINAAILDGDLVVVERTPVADNGEIVVALIGDEATVKRFYKENGYFRLQPENDRYKPIITKELAILGKVRMVIRNY